MHLHVILRLQTIHNLKTFNFDINKFTPSVRIFAPHFLPKAVEVGEGVNWTISLKKNFFILHNGKEKDEKTQKKEAHFSPKTQQIFWNQGLKEPINWGKHRFAFGTQKRTAFNGKNRIHLSF